MIINIRTRDSMSIEKQAGEVGSPSRGSMKGKARLKVGKEEDEVLTRYCGGPFSLFL